MIALFLLASVLPLALASPLSARDTTNFTLIAARSASPIHLQSINANGGYFWIGKETDSSCPLGHKACPPGTATVLAVSEGSCNLDVEVTGGQKVYVENKGALGYLEAGATNLPRYAVLTGFTYTPGTSFGTFDGAAYRGQGFIACPAKSGKAPYKVFIDVRGISNSDVPSGNYSDCLGFDALAPSYTTDEFGAFEYI